MGPIANSTANKSIFDKKVKALWVKRLRSKKDKQGKFFLKDGDGRMCCMGVLAEICRVPSERVKPDKYYLYDFEGLGMSAYPPAGFKGLTKKQIGILMQLNDRDQWTFPQIADWIEENL